MDKRALFFLVAAAVCAVLAPVTDSHLRWLPIALACLYLLLSAGSWLDHRSRAKGQPNRPVM